MSSVVRSCAAADAVDSRRADKITNDARMESSPRSRTNHPTSFSGINRTRPMPKVARLSSKTNIFRHLKFDISAVSSDGPDDSTRHCHLLCHEFIPIRFIREPFHASHEPCQQSFSFSNPQPGHQGNLGRSVLRGLPVPYKNSSHRYAGLVLGDG